MSGYARCKHCGKPADCHGRFSGVRRCYGSGSEPYEPLKPDSAAVEPVANKAQLDPSDELGWLLDRALAGELSGLCPKAIKRAHARLLHERDALERMTMLAITRTNAQTLAAEVRDAKLEVVARLRKLHAEHGPQDFKAISAMELDAIEREAGGAS